MKNSKPWFDFLSAACPEGKGVVQVQRSETPEGILHLDLFSQGKLEPIHVRFAVCLLDSEGLSLTIHSGEVSSAIAALDNKLREIRVSYPGLPLLVASAPEILWPRSHAWMLGEYLAERDLPLWMDLRALPENRVIQWLGRLQDTGLTNPRMVVEGPAGTEVSPSGSLSGSGAWLACVRSETEDLEMSQM